MCNSGNRRDLVTRFLHSRLATLGYTRSGGRSKRTMHFYRSRGRLASRAV